MAQFRTDALSVAMIVGGAAAAVGATALLAGSADRTEEASACSSQIISERVEGQRRVVVALSEGQGVVVRPNVQVSTDACGSVIRTTDVKIERHEQLDRQAQVERALAEAQRARGLARERALQVQERARVAGVRAQRMSRERVAELARESAQRAREQAQRDRERAQRGREQVQRERERVQRVQERVQRAEERAQREVERALRDRERDQRAQERAQRAEEREDRQQERDRASRERASVQAWGDRVRFRVGTVDDDDEAFDNDFDFDFDFDFEHDFDFDFDFDGNAMVIGVDGENGVVIDLSDLESQLESLGAELESDFNGFGDEIEADLNGMEQELEADLQDLGNELDADGTLDADDRTAIQERVDQAMRELKDRLERLNRERRGGGF